MTESLARIVLDGKACWQRFKSHLCGCIDPSVMISVKSFHRNSSDHIAADRDWIKNIRPLCENSKIFELFCQAIQRDNAF